MTEDKMDLQARLGKSPDADFLREMIGFAAERLMREMGLHGVILGKPDFSEADLVSPDLVILMSGPIGVYDGHRYPWIAHEIERMRSRLMLDRPTIGVCLGAQMIAAALGARVYRGAAKEIGFHRLTLNADGLASPLAHLADQPVLQ